MLTKKALHQLKKRINRFGLAGFSFFALIFLTYWIGLLPILKGANDLPYSSAVYLMDLPVFPTAWGSANGPFGQNQLSTLWSFTSNFWYGIGANLGLPYGLTVTLLGIFPILVLGGWGMYKYSSLFLESELARWMAGFFFLVNSYILLIIDGGQLLWGLSYAAFPICLYQIEKKFRDKKFQLSWLDFSGVIFLSFCDLRAVYLLGSCIFLRVCYYLIFAKNRDRFVAVKFITIYGFLTLILLFLLHSFWIIPLFLSGSQVIPSNLVISTTADFLQFLSLGHALFLQQPHWYKNIYGDISPLNPLFGLIPVLVFLPLFFKGKKSSVCFLCVLSLMGIFLAKGTGAPFGGIFEQLFKWVPGFFLFRDSSKFLVLVAVSYAVLFGYTTQKLLSLKGEIFRIKIGYLATGLIIVYLLWLYSPAFTNQMGGLLGISPDLEKYRSLEKIIPGMPDGKILWIPSKPPLAYMDPKHMGVNAVDLINLRPFSTGTRGTYETLNFLREASYSGELLKISGIKYLGYAPLNPRQKYKPDQIAYHQTLLEQLKERLWVKGTENENGIPLLRLENAEKLFFIPENTLLVAGSDKVYGESTKSAELSLSKNGLIFLDEKQGLARGIPEPLNKFLLYQKSKLDLMMSFVSPNQLVFPAQKLANSPDLSGWWKREAIDFLWFKDFLVQKYGIVNQDFDLGGGWAIAEGERELKIPVKAKMGDRLFIRAMHSTRSGELAIKYGQTSFSINLNNQGDNVYWEEGGVLNQDINQVIFQTKGDITLVNAITVLSTEEQKLLERKTDILSQKGRLFSDYAAVKRGEDLPKVTYKKMNDDQYKVSITGVKEPAMLVFGQSYDPKWQLAGQQAFKAYSMFNGFVVTRDGEYEVEYSPHKYLHFGMLISLTTLFGLSGLLIWKKFVKH